MGSLLRLIPSLHLPAELSLSFPTLEPAQNASSQPVRDFQSAHTSPSPALPPFPSSAPFPFCLFRNCPWGSKKWLQAKMGILPQRGNGWKNQIVPPKSPGCCWLGGQEHFGGQGMGRAWILQILRVCAAPNPAWEELGRFKCGAESIPRDWEHPGCSARG